jgi:hypothetical protein
MKVLLYGIAAAFSLLNYSQAAVNQLQTNSSSKAASSLQPAAEKTSCSFYGFINESDKAGLNVRAGHSLKARILGKIPPAYVGKYGVESRVEVSVIATRDGWFLISGAGDNETLLQGVKPRSMYKGKGWISGRKLAVKTQATQARLEPSVKAESAFMVGNVLDGDSLSRPGQLIGCKGKWALLEYTLDKNDVELIDEIKINPQAKISESPIRIRGWVNKLCGIQETSCSGLKDE